MMDDSFPSFSFAFASLARARVTRVDGDRRAIAMIFLGTVALGGGHIDES
jgi:hypothetical protein